MKRKIGVVAILIASESDKVFIKKGLNFLKKRRVPFELNVVSVHRTPSKAHTIISSLLQRTDLRCIISGAATATGLPGIIAGNFQDTSILVFGVRFSKGNPASGLVEDASFMLSSMPAGCPLAYMGCNQKGFLHACQYAAKTIGN